MLITSLEDIIFYYIIYNDLIVFTNIITIKIILTYLNLAYTIINLLNLLRYT